MRVRVLYFGALKEAFAGAQEEVELPVGGSVAELVSVLRGRTSNPESSVWKAMAVAVNREYAKRETVLRDGDEVALLPPVSGVVLRTADRSLRSQKI